MCLLLKIIFVKNSLSEIFMSCSAGQAEHLASPLHKIYGNSKAESKLLFNLKVIAV
jgi:hypothetical protein